MSSKLKAFMKKAIDLFPLQNVILIESRPDFSGSSKILFEELLRRGLNHHYKMVWKVSSSSGAFPSYKNVYYVSNHRMLEFVRHLAKLFISENLYFKKARPEQYMFHVFHGGSFKDVRGYYKAPENIDEVISLSPYLLEADAENYGCRPEVLKPLGFPRNDALLEERKDLHLLFSGRQYKRLIYWLPTFRQHKGKSKITHSSISIPLIQNAENAAAVNDAARANDVLIVVKPHFVQDISYIRKLQLSNLLFIDDQFLAEHDISNYELLNSSDALLSDYSSVYYDYLLTDRPIGLCWEDYEEYRQREGFIVDPEMIMAGGEKLYSLSDLCSFIERISAGTDLLAKDRRRIRNLIFPEGGKRCTGLVADRVEEVLSQL